MKIGDLLIFSEKLVDTQILGIVVELYVTARADNKEIAHVVVAATGLENGGLRTYSMDVINSFARVAK